MPVDNVNTAGYVINVGAVGISGAIFGMPVEALILGGIGGAVAQGLGRSGNNPALAVLTSVMLAGSLAPAVTHFLSLRLGLSDTLLRAAVPLIIGIGWPWLWPIVSGHLRHWINALLAKFSGGVR